MSDIVERLRAVDHQSLEDCFLQSPLFDKAADEITRLRTALSEAEQQEKRARRKGFEDAYALRMKKHRSGCACHLDDNDKLVSMCQYHIDLIEDERRKTQSMHRRAQESERVEQMIFDTLGTWFRLYNEGRFKPRAKRALFFVVLKELKARAEKIRGRRALIPSEPHDAEGRE